ncbi:hypothetical protein CkaCkLH20_01656 [Colletotrichum karsti]|uniref:Carrier domain-containing protein n=1 Tax=Colletotrichum karsti TaxID=1095194 RepID=A0A9P6IDV1_9PEZI|nr:uncharacterized protein CkaCkLH20_01656 [Colletotrichum karsti]KAF9880614.1 hypothetical protein CkaCkLH20_01656 [Colletotrichum karsti]
MTKVNGTNGDNHTNGINGVNHTNGVNGANHTNGVNGHANGVNSLNEKAVPIAICGMGVRLPGGVSTAQEFWEFLINKGDARGRVPESRYNVSAYHEKTKRPTTVATEYGYFLDDSVKLGAMDTSRFSMSRADVEFSDPQQRRILEVVTEALEDAGESKFRGKTIGCYFGNMNEDWGEMLNRDPLWHGPNKIDGYQDWMLANRISYEFGLTGPSMTIRTACSSSLVCLNEACSAIQRGICEGAVVAGGNLMLAPGMTQQMTEKGILSPEGSCKTFSADADGYARGEAFAAVFLKPLDAAVRDGNPIRAVIRAAVANSDGKTHGITQPNAAAHEAMIRLAYEQAGITDFSKTAYFECHGTGTAVGDPIETGAVANVFGDKGIHITSVKPNVGHTEGASGLVSLIKAVMSLEHRTIPPNIKFNIPNPKIAFKQGKLTVPVEPTPFPADRLERVSVNSFGLGGSNAHVVLDSARSFNVAKSGVRDSDRESEPQLLLFSAASAASLKSMVANYDAWMAKNPEVADRLDDLAYTLANRREHLPYRASKVAGPRETPVSQGGKIPSQPLSLVMVFTGQGAQWPRMGRELLQRDDLVFQKTVRALDQYLQALPKPPGWTIEAELQKSAKTSRVQKPEFSQPLCTAIQIGLVDLFASVGIEASAVVGHSSGELAAAYAAGALTAKEAIVGAYLRGQAANLQDKKGAMAAVGLGRAEVKPFLVDEPHVVIACENSPQSVTLSGDYDIVQSTLARIRDAHPDITARLLKVEKAYHSYHMGEIGDQYHAMIEPHLQGQRPSKAFFSSVTGVGEPESDVLGAKYWQKNLQQPVLFNSAVAGILKHVKNPAFIEIGPHGALAGPARQIFAKASASPPYVSSLVRNEDSVQSYLASLGRLFELNLSLDYAAIAPAGETLPDLPTYPWNYEGDFWIESRMSSEWRNPRFPRHPLLGRPQLESTSLEPSWRNLINIEDAPWLRDHQVQGVVVFPAAGYFAMAGEAIRQLTGVETSYSLRQVVLSQALILEVGADTEVVTNLRPHHLTASAGKGWWEFTIASFNGNAWTKHCSGQVTAIPSVKPAQAEGIKSLPRKLETSKVFNILWKAGMEYGPAFQRLDGISTGTLETRATSRLTDNQNGDEDKYHLHPTIIDAALQAGLVAARSGKLDVNNCAAMPTLIEELTIFSTTSRSGVAVEAVTEVQPGSHEIRGHYRIVTDGKLVLDIPRATFTPLEQGGQDVVHKLPISARANWQPHIDFLDAASLLRPRGDIEKWTPVLNELAELCFIFFQRCIQDVTLSPNPSVQRFAAWVNQQFLSLSKTHPGHSLDMEQIVDKAHAIGASMADSPFAACADSLLEVGGNIADLLTGERDILDVLAKDDLLIKVLASSDTVDRAPFLRSLAHARPSLRVLELGATTAQLTSSLLNDLSLPNGGSLYFKYTFTDPSPTALAAAKKQFQPQERMDFRVLDIAKNPAEQDFKDDEKYDLIVATNIVHATPSLSASLANIRTLLAPGGRLLLQELHTESKWVNCILGLLDDWWVGRDDGRPNEPYVSPERWEAELKGAGFAAPDVVLDGPVPNQLSTAFVARHGTDVSPTLNKNVTLLAHTHDGKNVGAVVQSLKAQGYVVVVRAFGDELPRGQDVISLLDEDEPFFHQIDKNHFQTLQKHLASIAESGIFWVTRPSQMQSKDPLYATAIGAIRSIRNEEAIDFATCEVELVTESLDSILAAFAHFQNRLEDAFFRPNYEYAILDGTINVPRIYPFTFGDERAATRDENDRVSLVAERPGRLTSLAWESRHHAPPIGDQVDIEVFYAGLTSKDVSEIMGTIRYPAEGLGTSVSGRVSAVGAGVKGFAVGDRVIGLGPGSLSSHLRTSEALVAKIPDAVSLEAAATLPAAYGTAVAALYELGNLRAGQSVLIHDAATGVGLAILELAKTLGAVIFATVRSADEASTLARNFGLPRNRIFWSTDDTFLREITLATGGDGVDLALNTLRGELSHATWNSVAAFGRMIDIGAADFLGAHDLETGPFLDGRSYTGLDFEALVTGKKSIVKRILQTVAKLLNDGVAIPLSNRVVFEASRVEDAVKHVQDQAGASADVILQLRDIQGTLTIDWNNVKVIDVFKTDDKASYLLAGGLGGIGTVIARHLVENGARRLVCLSRNPGSRPGDAEIIQELESMGCDVVLVKGDMVNKDDIYRAVRQAPNLKGILHSPMLLQDEAFRNMTVEQWTKVIGPKVQGALYLHEATVEAGIELDFFVLLSSLSAVTGQPGQANYAGANAFLDAFTLWRNSKGLPASSIDIGAVADMGYAARDQQLLQRLLRNGYSGVTESEMIEAFRAAASYPVPDITVTGKSLPFTHKNTFSTGFSSDKSYSHPDSHLHWKKDIRMAVWHNISDGDSRDGGAGGDGFKEFLARAKIEPEILEKPESAEYIANEIGNQLMRLLLRPDDEIDITLPVQQLGLDSLVGIELRNWWRQTLGFDISVLQLLGFGTLEELGRQAVKGLVGATK